MARVGRKFEQGYQIFTAGVRMSGWVGLGHDLVWNINKNDLIPQVVFISSVVRSAFVNVDFDGEKEGGGKGC